MPFSGYFAEAARTRPDFLTVQSVALPDVVDVPLDEWGDDSWMVEDWFEAGDEQRLDSALLLDDDRPDRDETTLTRTMRWLRDLMA
ncbi:MAG: hypothetical protein KC503_24740 [Myxococcales bacterium]|nr:hypothetical protein [Myxococcales bacterium]